jgi:alpha-D-xyloside xylohydrolase
VDYLSIPLWAAENSVIPVGVRDDRPDYDYADEVTLHIFNIRDGAMVEVTVPDTLGAARAIFHCERQSQTLTITRQGAPGKWNVLVRGNKSKPISVTGDEVTVTLS